MKKFSTNFFYKRNLDKTIVMSRSIKTLKVGDVIKFHGKLFSDRKHENEVGEAVIVYKIILINSEGVLISAKSKYIIKDKGTMIFAGNIFSPNFDITNNVVSSYTTKPMPLVFSKGTDQFEHAYGSSDYIASGNGLGEFMINIGLLA